MEHQSFVDDQFFRINGPLDTPEKALAYFESSGFYDKKANNTTVRSQQKPIDALKQLTGLEYALIPTKLEPALFVVAKQKRSGPTTVHREALYYIIRGVIHQSPNVHKLFASRLQKPSTVLLGIFKELSASVELDPSKGFVYNSYKNNNNVITVEKTKNKIDEITAHKRRIAESRVDDALMRTFTKYNTNVNVQPNNNKKQKI